MEGTEKSENRCDLVHDVMNFFALKLRKGICLWSCAYMQCKRQLTQPVICDKVLKFAHFGWGTSLVMSLGNRPTD